MTASRAPQIWSLDTGTLLHRVDVTPARWSRQLAWSVDGVSVATKKSSEDTVVLTATDSEQQAPGAVRLTFSSLGRVKRVTWFESGPAAHLGLGGIDLDPAPGSAAARREERAREHPRLHALRHVMGGVAKVVVPLLIAALLARFAVRIPWPELPFPDLPSLPSPDLPQLPWPDWSLPDWSLPGWLAWIVQHAKYVIPILFGVALATNEVKRRRKQDALKAEMRAGRESGEDPGTG